MYWHRTSRSVQEALEIAGLSGRRNSLGAELQTVYDLTIIGMRSVTRRAQAPMAERQLCSRLQCGERDVKPIRFIERLETSPPSGHVRPVRGERAIGGGS